MPEPRDFFCCRYCETYRIQFAILIEPADDFSIVERLTFRAGAFIEPALEASKSPLSACPEVMDIEPAEDASQLIRSAFTAAIFTLAPDDASRSMCGALRFPVVTEAPEDASMSSLAAVSDAKTIFPAEDASRLIFFLDDEIGFVHFTVAPEDASTELTIGADTVTVTPLIFLLELFQLRFGWISSVLPLTFTSINSICLAPPDIVTLVFPPVVGL